MYSPQRSPPEPLLKRTLHSHESDPEPLGPPAVPRNDSAVVGSSLPPEFIERGEVTSAEEMTTRYTDAEWAEIIAKTQEKVGEVDDGKAYDVPEILVKTIDHTLLKLEAKKEQFDELCAEARNNGFATVCVRPPHVAQCLSNLKGSDIKVASVIGFHEGTYDLSNKIQETRQSITAGALELDVVINWPQLQQKSYSAIYNELGTIRTLAPHPVLLKLIFETSQLSRSEIIAACTLAAAANFDFVKTSTGFCGAGATVEHVRLMKACCAKLAEENGGRKMKVKASGGIRTLDDAVKMLQAGASRLGTSGGVWIAKEAREEKGNGERPGLATRLFTDY